MIRFSLTLLAACVTVSAFAADPTPLTRLIFQDHSSGTLRWADVSVDEKGGLTLGNVANVEGFAPLDAKQKLVQMKEVDGKILVGVRDVEEGKFGSGWVIVSAGARYHSHGDHGHWDYKRMPEVWDRVIDTEQGNPAHLYVYGGKFYLANDLKNGYSRFDPAEWHRTAGGQIVKGKPTFIPGGGNHITLAVSGDKVGYASWIDGGGPNKGKVDVTPLSSPGISYSFTLPTGVIHGATACEGKVFFAPADGVCWVNADLNATIKPAKVKINHITLGKDGDKPLRTGAFATHDKQVFFVTGKEVGAKLVVLDAKQADPKPVFVALNGLAETKPLTPEVVLVGGKVPMAFVFQDKEKDSKSTDRLEVVSLDPNSDGNYSDAKVVKSFNVGASAVDGHFGHHSVAFDADGTFAFFTNSGDGSISVLDLKKMEIVASFKVGGKPTAVLAHGGRTTDD